MFDTGDPGAADGMVSFGPFKFLSDRRVLLRDNYPLKIGGRAFDLLRIFVERAGDTLTKDELIDFVWPNVFVHDTNLKVTISSLRRLLGETAPHPTYIATIPGRGYRFIAPVASLTEPAAEPFFASVSAELSRLPPSGEIVGRGREIGAAVEMLGQRRMVSIVGPGGIGKSTVAIAAARRLTEAFPDGVDFVDLSLIQDDQLVPTVVASALGVRGSPADVTAAVVESIVNRRKLILLDNCEHVVRGVQALASRILGSGAASRLLLTSRERIGAREETLLLLGALPFPEGGAARTSEDALKYPAIQLFLLRALEWTEFEFRPEQAAVVSQICRSLDGVPLALELVAAQLNWHEPEDLLALLDSHLATFDNRNSEAPSRQQTLWATLDWSYQLLAADEALVFRFLSVFAGPFDLEGVLAVLGPFGLDAYSVTITVGGLVSKSLVVAQAEDSVLNYRLLDSARSYAAEQARQDGRLQAARENYALYLASVLDKAGEEWVWREVTDWRSRYKPQLNDLRQALDWCFAEGGRPALGVRLTTAALLLWDEHSAVLEARGRIEQALAYAEGDEGRCDLQSMAKLARAHAWGLLYAEQISPESVDRWNAAIRYAEQSGDVETQLRALWGYAVYLSHTGHCEQALTFLDRFRELAIRIGEEFVLPDGEWLYAQTEIYLARLGSARERFEALVKANPLAGARTRVGRFVVDRCMTVRTYLALVLWITGEPARALAVADEVSNFDEKAQHLISQIVHVAWTRLPIALWERDWLALSELTTTLRSLLEIENIAVWYPVLQFHQALVDYYAGDKSAVRDIRRAVDGVLASNLVLRVPAYLGVLAELLLQEGRLLEAQSTIDEALAAADRYDLQWSTPELLRISAGVRLASGDRFAAIKKLGEAAAAALSIGANHFALRAANDLAEVCLGEDQAQPAIDVLAPIYQAYTEGFETSDLVRASALLDQARKLLARGL